MAGQLIITVISDDKPGIVKQLADTIHRHHGNWQESKLTRLAGKFAGIIQVDVDDAQRAKLVTAINELKASGLSLLVEESNSEAAQYEDYTTWTFSIFGNDRTGIVHEVTQAFANRNINLEEMNSHCSSIPHVGTPLFEATGRIRIPNDLDINDLESNLGKISDDLAVDIQLEKHIE